MKSSLIPQSIVRQYRKDLSLRESTVSLYFVTMFFFRTIMEVICLHPQMFEYMNSYDLACSVGGGEDSSAVLQGAGLTFICNCALKTPTPTGTLKHPLIIIITQKKNMKTVSFSKQDMCLFFQNINVSLNGATGEEQTMLQNTMHLVSYETSLVFLKFMVFS